MLFSDELYKVVQRENPFSELLSTHRIQAQYEDLLEELKSDLPLEKVEFLECVLLPKIREVAEHAVKCMYETSFSVINNMWRQLIFDDMLNEIVEFKGDYDD